MATPQEIIEKVPRPILVIGILAIALALIVYSNPLQDGCDVQVTNFTRVVRGILTGFKNKSQRTQFAQIESFKTLCREGNSQGSCENYYDGLKKITDGLKLVDDKCVPKLNESFENLQKVLSNGIQIMALNAWGEQPPAGTSERMGWLVESDIYTFCRLKTQLIRTVSDEEYKSLRARTYAEFPEAWTDSITIAQRSEVRRPMALKSEANPKGSLVEEEIFKRSLFSLRCDLYL